MTTECDPDCLVARCERCSHRHTYDILGYVTCSECGLELRQTLGYSYRAGSRCSRVWEKDKLYKFLGKVRLIRLYGGIFRDFLTLSESVKRLPSMSILTFQLCRKNGVVVFPDYFEFPKSKSPYSTCKNMFKRLGWQWCEPMPPV